MHLEELLNSLSRLAKENDISEPYIVGGLPRDKVFGIQRVYLLILNQVF